MRINYHPKIIFGVMSISLGLVVVLLVVAAAVVKPKVVAVVPSSEPLSLVSPLKVKFNVPPARRHLKPTITPEIEGSWSWEGGVYGGHLSRTLVFEPETSWNPEHQYSLELNGLTGTIPSSEKTTESIEFETKPLPIISSASVEEGQQDVQSETVIAIEADQPIGDTVDFSFQLEPVHEIEVTLEPGNKRFLIKPTTPLLQGRDYKLIVEREHIKVARSTNTIVSREDKTRIFERNFRTKSPAKIEKFEPAGTSVLPGAKEILVVFNEPMVRQEVETNFSVTPQPKGSLSWDDGKTLRYLLAEPLKKATEYSLKINKGTKSESGAFLEEDVLLQFSTVGHIRITGVVPSKKSGNSVATDLRLTFDQPVDRQSVQNNFSVSPTVAGSFQWRDQTVTFRPNENLAYNTDYTLSLKAGVQSLYGLDLATNYSYTFRTEEKVVILNIAWDRQDRALSCEAAALKMALAGKGVRVSEDDIMARIGFDLTPKGNGVWGDPNLSFVGDINGSQNSTGYGVHWDPIVRAAKGWRDAKAVSGMSLSQVARELEAGNPIVFWGVTGSAYYDPWQTPEGKTINAWKGEHTRTLIGFKGSVENPTSFIINDPQSGRLTWSASKLQDNWATFNNTGVIIY